MVGMFVRGSLTVLDLVAGPTKPNPFNSSIECIKQGEYIDLLNFVYATGDATKYSPKCAIDCVAPAGTTKFTYNGKLYCGCPAGNVIIEQPLPTSIVTATVLFKCDVKSACLRTTQHFEENYNGTNQTYCLFNTKQSDKSPAQCTRKNHVVGLNNTCMSISATGVNVVVSTSSVYKATCQSGSYQRFLSSTSTLNSFTCIDECPTIETNSTYKLTYPYEILYSVYNERRCASQKHPETNWLCEITPTLKVKRIDGTCIACGVDGCDSNISAPALCNVSMAAYIEEDDGYL